ncbi:hypothetical protein [Phytopseudomonas punonensis]|uniref:Uncharacterized protein n=1 Tax=Phytopseudomonas punonensis TaxID=1220495 RepID=A0A1M7MYN8_9GAMM|nr:hypothetical protein [Pseudomonas punonensis]SHM96326.1 hypothetical protein SAMN05216288_0152 [Pseudomonas punonensis]
MSTITPSGASSAPPLKVSPGRTTDSSNSKAKPASEPEQQPSVTVTLSEYAQKRAKTMREAFGKLSEMQARQAETRKDAARQRLEDIKRRIEMLKQLVMALGPAAAKGALRQIKQLAQELGQAAAVLKEPSGGGSSTIDTAQAASGESEGTAAQGTETVDAVTEVAPDAEVEVEAETPEVNAEAAELAAGEEAEEGDEPVASEEEVSEQAQAAINQTRNERNERQRRADAEELKKVAAQLKQLLAMVRSQISGKPDDESKKLIEGIDKQLADVEKAATEMSGGGLSISVSVGASLSISV